MMAVVDSRCWGGLLVVGLLAEQIDQRCRLGSRELARLAQSRMSTSGKSLDVPNWSREDGTPIQQWTFAGQPNQRWVVMRLPGRNNLGTDC